jgi:large subunit ribosomal protein LP0
MVTQIEKKALYFERFSYLFSEYSRIIIVNTENICSNQFKKCRKALGKDSILILGKNKVIKKVLNEHIKKKPELVSLLPHLSGNLGFIFTKADPLQIKNILFENKIPAPAKVGQMAPSDVIIPEGITGLTPDATSFFQALNIQTKISKGLIEIMNPVKIISKNQFIGSSEVTLLQKLDIVPFSHQLKIKLIYENNFCIDPSFLEISMGEIEKILNEKSEELGFLESFFSYSNPIKLENVRKKTLLDVLYLSQKLGFSFEKKETNKRNLETDLNSKTVNSDKNPKEFEKSESEEEEEEDMGLGLFD